MNINCLVIDDEPSSQQVLAKYISDVDFLHLKGVFNNAIDALEELKKGNEIDLLFLDINMPKISGLTFYKSLKNPPYVIFTTAYPKYAVDGFEVNAIDFLLKPFSFDRFFIAINKVLDKYSKVEKNVDKEHFILIKANKILHKIASKNILYIEAFGDYVKVHLEDDFILTYNTFGKILEQLPSKQFIQSHKSFAVNLNKINSINGNQISMSSHGIPIGQKYKIDFFEMLKG